MPVYGCCGRSGAEKEDIVEVREVWKYELPHIETELEVPLGAQAIHVDAQKNKLCVWMMVDPTEDRMETKVFRVIHTGSRFFLSDVEYIGTVLMKGETYVAHVFEVV